VRLGEVNEIEIRLRLRVRVGVGVDTEFTHMITSENLFFIYVEA
jgi:hypothetical protein